MKSLKNTQGFSLVELMVVVAIIGILAALSVGQVSKQIAKSRQSEAKTNLASLYTAEKSLYAEFAAYSTDFKVLATGFEGNLRYNTGFKDAVGAPAGYTGASGGAKDAKNFCDGVVCTLINSNGVPPNGTIGTANSSTATQFNAGATSFIYQSTVEDLWSMNDNKLLTNEKPGIQ